jgi:phospholipid/cholesterol/gamma-HCH transport system substrate-binding protein
VNNNKLNYVVVGGFVLAMGVGLMVALALLTGRTGASDGYFTVYRNVAGIKFGTQVLYEGYPIGQVEEITPMERDGTMLFRVDFAVVQGWRIPQGSVARIASSGLLAAVTLNIDAGPGGAAMEPGSRVEGREADNIFAAVSSVASDMTNLTERSLKPLLANIDRTVSTVAGLLEGDVRDLVGQLASLARDLSVLALDMSERLPKIADNIETFTEKMNTSSDELRAFLSPENRKSVEDLIATADATIESYARVAGDLGLTRKKLDRFLEVINTMVSDNRLEIEKSIVDLRYVIDSMARNVDSLNQNLDGAARNMYEFSRQIRKNPGLLLGGTPPTDKGASQ